MDTSFLISQSHEIKFPSGDLIEEFVDSWSQHQSVGARSDPLESPLKRKVDIWLLAIAYAVNQGLPPRTVANLSKFVTVGPNGKHDVRLDSQVLELLLLVAIWHQREHVTRESVPDAAQVFLTCNQYAAAGIERLVDEFTGERATTFDPRAIKLAKLAARLTARPAMPASPLGANQ